MPRFGPSSPILSPEEAFSNSRAIQITQPPKGHNDSVGLICTSPDGRTVYSVSMHGHIYLDAHSLPLHGTAEETNDEREIPPFIRIRLPEVVKTAMQIEQPIELICVDGDATASRKTKRQESNMRENLRTMPLLCLYTDKSAFLLHLGYEMPEDIGAISPVLGEVLSLTEPLESYLLSALPSTSIIRIRPAPQRSVGSAMICPPGSMAILTDEYALVLRHGEHGNHDPFITTPLEFGLEELAEGDNIITDFAFCQSRELPLLSSMSILLLKASGEIFGASPILFDGAVAPREIVKASIDFLEGERDSLKSGAKSRQCIAALQFMRDAFSDVGSLSNRFVAARMHSSRVENNAISWPLQIQGPLLDVSNEPPEEYDNAAFGIEQMDAKGLVGVTIGRTGHCVDFVIVSPSTLLPRFKYEAGNDQIELDEALFQSALTVESLNIESKENENARPCRSPLLRQDPLDGRMLHYITRDGVITISTNALELVSNEILGTVNGQLKKPHGGLFSHSTHGSKQGNEISTFAWSSIEVSNTGNPNDALAGAVISSEPLFGHVLVARLSNGSIEAVNMTESRLLHKPTTVAVVDDKTNTGLSKECSVVDQAAKAVEATPPLYEVLKPLFQQMEQGLAGMAKIVGSGTAPKDITSSELAMVLATKKRCDREVVEPLRRLKQHKSSRMDLLNKMYRSQVEQLNSLVEMRRSMEQKLSSMTEKLKIIESNASALSRRSASVLQASRALLPTISEADAEYFAKLNRLEATCSAWEETVGELQDSYSHLSCSMESDNAVDAETLDEQSIGQCHDLLRGQQLIMSRSHSSLNRTKEKVRELATAAGVRVDEDVSAVHLYTTEQ